MKQMILLLSTVLLSWTSISWGADDLAYSDPIVDVATGMRYQTDQFHNAWPDITSLTDEQLQSGLSKFVEYQRQESPGNAIIVRLPLSQMSYTQTLVNCGFKHHFTTDATSEWIVKNGSSRPAALTTISGANMIFLKDNAVLVLEEAGYSGTWNFPGGSQDSNEFPDETARRKAREEVGLTVKEDMLLVAEWYRKNSSRYGANDTCKFYLVTKFSGEVITQSNKIKQAQWAPINQLLDVNAKYLGLTFAIPNRIILLHVMKHIHEDALISLPDIRQQSKRIEDRDPKDIMKIQLFAVSSAKL